MLLISCKKELVQSNVIIHDDDFTPGCCIGPSVGSFSPAQFANPAFMVFACDIVRPINSFSHGSDIAWGILLYEENEPMVLNSVTQVGNKLTIHYPTR
jgi:hypothetical protein